MTKQEKPLAVDRLSYLDSIRGIAALLVIYFHIAEDLLELGGVSPVEQFIFTMWTEWIDLGKFAVTLFFAISGFLIPYSLLKAGDTPIRDFAIGRFFRLYPAYWVSIPFGILALNVVLGDPLSLVVVVFNITMLQQFFGIENIIGVYWTLQIELIFYFLCVVMFYFGVLQSNKGVFRTGVALIAFSMILAVARFVTDEDFPVALGLALTVMFFGLLWRRNVIDGDHEARTKSLGLLAIFVCLLPIIAVFAYEDFWLRYVLTYYLALAALIILTTKIKLRHPLLVYLGTISYSVYLFGTATRVFVMQVVPDGAGGALHGHFLTLLTMIFTILIAMLVYHGIEKPAIRLGRKVIKRLKATPRADHPAPAESQ